MDWRTTILNLQSERITDRGRGIKSLFKLLESDEQMQLLVTLGPEISMEDVFQAVNLCIAADALNLQEKEGRPAACVARIQEHKSTLRTMMERLMEKVEEKRCLVDASILTRGLASVFLNTYLRENFGGIYYTSIVFMLLKYRSYWGKLGFVRWKELIRISIVAYNDQIIGLMKSRVGKAISYLLSQGTKNSRLSIWIISKIDFFKSCILGAPVDQPIPDKEAIMMMILSFAKAIAVENRKMLCQFGEEVLEDVFRLMDHSVSETDLVKCLILDFVNLQIKAHHPRSEKVSSLASYADDWCKWTKLLSLMYYEICDEMQNIAKRSQRSCEEVIYGRCLEFSVEIVYQITILPEPGLVFDYEDEEPVPRKRKKIISGLKSVLQMIQDDNLDEDVWPWLALLAELIDKHNEIINPGNYMEVLYLTVEMLGASRGNLVMNHALRCCTSLAKITRPERYIDDANELWEKVWDITLRSIGLSYCEEAVNETIRAVLNMSSSEKKISELLRLFMIDCFPVSGHNLRTLEMVMYKYPIMETMKCSTKKDMVKWVFEIRPRVKISLKPIPVDVLAFILVQLCSKGNKQSPLVSSISQSRSLEDYYLKINFCRALSMDLHPEKIEPVPVIYEEMILDDDVVMFVKDLICLNVENTIEWLGDLIKKDQFFSECFEGTEYATSRLKLLVLMFSNLINWKGTNITTVCASNFLQLFPRIFRVLSDLLVNIFVKRKDLLFHLKNTINELKSLYELPLEEELMAFVIKKTPRTFINFCMNIIKERPEEIDELFGDRRREFIFTKINVEPYVAGSLSVFSDFNPITDKNVLARDEVIRVLVSDMMGSFCCSHANFQACLNQRQVIAHYLTVLPLEYKRNFPLLLQMVVAFFSAPIRRGAIESPYLNCIMTMCIKFVDDNPGDVEVFNIALSTFEEILKKDFNGTSTFDIVIPHLQSFIEKFESCSKDNVPPSTLKRITRIVGCIAKADYSWTSNWLQSSGEPLQISTFLLQMLDTDFAEVRLNVAEHLWAIFKQLHHARLECRPTLHTWINYILGSCCEDVTPTPEMKENQILCGLHGLTIVAIATPYFRKIAIYNIMKFLIDFKISQNVGGTVLSVICRELKVTSLKNIIERYMQYFIEKWLLHGELEKFPYWLSYSSLSNFYHENKKIIFSVMWILNHKDLELFCSSSQSSLKQMLLENSANVLAFTLRRTVNLQDNELSEKIKRTTHHVVDQVTRNSPGLTFYQIVSSKENSLLYESYSLYHDHEALNGACTNSIVSENGYEVCIPEPNPYYYSQVALQESLDCLAGIVGADTSLLKHCISNSPNHLRDVMHKIAKDAVNAPSQSDSFVSLVAFNEFVECIAKELQNSSVSNISLIYTGFFRDVCFTYVRIMRRRWWNEDDVVSSTAFFFLEKMLTRHHAPFENALKILITPLIGALVDLVEDRIAKNFEGHVLKTIEDLVQMDFLRGAMHNLCPFPSLKTYDKIRNLFKTLISSEIGISLRRTFTQFLENYNTYGYCRIESLLHMQSEIKVNKEELNVFYEELKLKKKAFSLYKGCVLHRVMCLLTRLCRSTEPKQATEAAKCLAEIGSADLETLVLTHQNFETEDVPSDVMEKNPLHKLILKCMEIIPRYLLDNDLIVVETASSALHDIIDTAEGVLALSLRKPRQTSLAEDFLFDNPGLSSKQPLSPLEFDEGNFAKTVGLWIPCETTSHAEWITQLTKGLLSCIGGCPFIASLDKLCSLKVSLCEEIFPLVIEALLRCGGLICRDALFGRIGEFFSTSYRTFLGEMRGQTLDIDVPQLKNKTAILTMLNAINLLSLQHPGKHEEFRKKEKESTRRSNGGDLLDPKAINYLHCAVSAQHCSAFLSAIQYCALWLNDNARGSQPVTITIHIDLETEGIQQILYVLQKSYAGIGDVDSLSGCGIDHVLQPKGRIEYFQHRGQWEQVMRSYELELSNRGPVKNVDGLLKSMQNVGMEELLMGTLDYREDEKFQKFRYECAWRLGSWDLLSKYSEKSKPPSGLCFLDSITYMPDNVNDINVEFVYHRNLFLALRCIKNKKFTESLEIIEASRKCVVGSMSLASLEVSNNLCEAITRLQILKDVQEFATSILNNGETAVDDIIDSWKRSDAIGRKTFRALESLKAVRVTLLKHCCGGIERDREGFVIIDQPPVRELIEILLELGGSAREMEMYSISEKYLRAVRELENVLDHPYFKPQLVLEEAKLFSIKGYKYISRNLLCNLIKGIDDLNCNSDNCLIYSQALTVLGQLTVETHAEKSKSALLRYFDRAAELISEFEISKSTEEFLNATASLATYADEQYMLLSKYVASSEFEKKKKAALDSMDIVSDGHNIKRPTLDEKRSMILLEKQAELDETEIMEAKADRWSYYMLAFRNYVKYLRYCDNSRLEMLFRFLFLLLEELDSEDEETMNQISCIPSYKFLPMIPQLIPRMTQSKGVYITSVIERCAMEHPHHVLPYIMVVAHSLSDLEKEKGSDTFITDAQKANSIAAQNLILRIKSNPELREYICQLEKLWQVLINFAKMPTANRSQRDIQISLPPRHPLNSLVNLDLVQIPTLELKVSPSKTYNIVSIWKYCPEFSLVGGINVPKKITCIGSNGLRYHQLLKGKDDMRQDAVMQQVFQLMNNLLMREDEAKKIDLRMRTYKVVPLSLRSGIIEWVENTISLGFYLQGHRCGGAHVRHNPQDYTPKLCRSMMHDVITSSKVVRQQVYIDIIEHIKPVFRHYFLENFPNPALWYEMRQAYTRSVATSSIIGYVLGLGDRHLYNMLIDEITSEVIHIDLGIAFEQGKTLNTPETVPFRLTRDIVDGMGVTGVEGVFRRSCEVTMTLMRKYKPAIISVLQVLIYDPLYSWTFKPKHLSPPGEEGASIPQPARPPDISKPGPSKPRASSSNEEGKSGSPCPRSSPALPNAPSLISSKETEKPEEERNAIAERAIIRLEQKLMGLDSGDQAPSSVEAQVERLFQEAQDIENLCMLFPGWQPFL